MDMRKLLVYAILALLASPGLAFAQSSETNQQSTTGPVPPPGVEAAKPDTVGLRSTDKLIDGVPGYSWRHGCGPTALAMVVGYYDTHGYPDMIPGDASTQTSSVNQALASEDSESNPQHYEDYALPMDSGESSPLADKSEPPSGDEHTNNCMADYMHTSWSSDGNFYGWSWSNRIGPAWQGYVNQVAAGYGPTYADYYPGGLSWEAYKTEIDNDRPMVLLVDTDGNGGTDHFVTGIGYRENGANEYACLDTWYPAATVRWETFQEIGAGRPWGIWGGTTFNLTQPPATATPTATWTDTPTDTPSPEPTDTPTDAPTSTPTEVISSVPEVFWLSQ